MENEKKLQSVFKELVQVNVNDYIEQKNGLNYLSWAFAVQEVCKRHDVDFDYEIEKFDRNLPYVYDEKTGYMVFTKVTLCGKTREMWLPVMDEKNKAMKDKSYTYKTKYGEKEVAPATMFDINKTIMRCLTKNLAMFGLGIYIYAGEDLPEDVKNELDALKEQIKKYPNALDVVKEYGKKLSDCKEEELREILNKLEKGDKNNE